MSDMTDSGQKKVIPLYMKAKTSFLTFLYSFFKKGKYISKNTTPEIKSEEIHLEEIQPLDLYTQYRNLYLDPTTTIRSRAISLGISRSTSERLLKKFKNIQRNKRVGK